MKKYVVITTIFEPSDAVKLIADLPDVDLIIVGDKKTPEDWHCKGAEYFSVDRQVELGFELSHILPFNHYCRKMIGYLVAAKDGAAMSQG